MKVQLTERERELVRAWLGHTDRWASAIEGYSLISPLGDHREAQEGRCKPDAICIYRPTADEVAAATAWHDYWDGHRVQRADGRKAAYDVANEAARAGAPPHPPARGKGEWIRITWADLRRQLADDNTAQLDLFSTAA